MSRSLNPDATLESKIKVVPGTPPPGPSARSPGRTQKRGNRAQNTGGRTLTTKPLAKTSGHTLEGGQNQRLIK